MPDDFTIPYRLPTDIVQNHHETYFPMTLVRLNLGGCSSEFRLREASRNGVSL